MSDLAELASRYGDRVGFIGLTYDFDSNPDGARNIVTVNGVPDYFLMLDANDASLAPLMNAVDSGSFPTTVLLSKDGFSDMIVGKKGAAYAREIDKLLE
jgi:hypothetical protein